MCTGRVDLSFVLRAFIRGADGVIVGGCWPGECHYVTEGNYDALGNVHLARKILGLIGVSPERLGIEWISASEGSRFAEVMSAFAGKVRALGALGRGEGLDEGVLGLRLEAASQLIPYLKLVERERLRVPKKSEKSYEEFFGSEETDGLIRDLVADKLAMSQILLLLREQPLSTGQIAERLGFEASEVSRVMNASSRQGLVRYDADGKRFALA
jgi:F420-non-reducing hydrogenase iron-sulfur subunit